MEFVPEHSPTILNASNHTIVVFQERGILFNRQVLQPGEAVSMTKKQTGGIVVPYKVHALIGDETCLPTSSDSRKNLIKVTAIPAAFVTGCMLTAISAGMLVGPSAALGPLVSGMVVNGVVIDSTALAAGGLAATRAQAVTDRLLKEQPDKFMCKTGRMRPGERYLVVTGGLGDGSVKIEEVKKKKFEKKYTVKMFKPPLLGKNNSTTDNNYCLPENDDDMKEDTDLIEAEEKEETMAQIEG
eukprot:scaffold2738_cov119-Cylindrotheca_fusiformis.AAC.2